MINFADDGPNTIILFQTATDVGRYSGGGLRIFSFRSITQSFDTNKRCSNLLSRKKATDWTQPDSTQSGWPSSVYRAAFQFSCTFVFIWTQGGISFSNRLRTLLLSGAKISAEQYSCKGTCSITN